MKAYPLSVPLSQPVDDGSELYMPFQEGTGRITADLTGNPVGTLENGASWVPASGKCGFALDFDGNDQYVEIANRPNLNGMAKLTVACVFKLDQLPSVKGEDEELLRKKHVGAPWNSYRLYANPANDRICFSVINASSVGATALSVSTASINTWYCAVGVYDGANVLIYLDAVPSTPAALTGNVYTSDDVLRIGANTDINRRLDGQIKEVRIYRNRVFSAGEVRRLVDSIH